MLAGFPTTSEGAGAPNSAVVCARGDDSDGGADEPGAVTPAARYGHVRALNGGSGSRSPPADADGETPAVSASRSVPPARTEADIVEADSESARCSQGDAGDECGGATTSGAGAESERIVRQLEMEARRNSLTIVKKAGGKPANMPLLPQIGKLIIGPGARKESLLTGLGLPNVRRRMRDAVENGRKYAMEQSVKHVLMKQTMAHQQNQQKITMYAQALSYMARIYVGGVGYEVKEDVIRHAFGPFGPIKAVTLSWDTATGQHRGFAFIEFEVPEAALLAEKHMNCQNLAGRMIKVENVASSTRNQPNPQCQPVVDMILREAAPFHRVYVASVHLDLTEDDLISVFEAFGTIKDCTLATVGDDQRGHRGYGYIEYETEQSCDDAVAAMHLFDLGGMFLRVGKAVTPPAAQSYVVSTYQHYLPTASAVAAAKITSRINSMQTAAGRMARTVGGLAPRVVVGLHAADVANAREIAHKAGTTLVAVPPPGVAVPSSLGGTVQAVADADGNPIEPGGGDGTEPSAADDGAEEAAAGDADGQQADDAGATADGKKKLSKSAARRQAHKRKKALEAVANPVHRKPRIDPADGVQGMAKKSADYGMKEERLFDGHMPEYTLHKVPVADELDPGQIANGINVIKTSVTVAPTNVESGERKVKGAQRNLVAVSDTTASAESAKLKAEKGQRAQIRATKIVQSIDLAAKRKDLLEDSATQGTLAAMEQLTVKGNDQRNMLMHKLMRNKKSTVIVLRNVVRPDDVDDTLIDEVHDECAKFGRPLHLTLCQEEQGGPLQDIVKIFVRFVLPAEASNAQSALNGRWFAGRQVACSVYDQNLYDHDDLTG